MANLPETLPPNARVHVVGAGPVGLLMTALLQSIPGFSVRLYEKRRQYTRTRMVRLASYLAADSVTNYRACQFDAHDVDFTVLQQRNAMYRDAEAESLHAFLENPEQDLARVHGACHEYSEAQ